jgi:hypothetical protein
MLDPQASQIANTVESGLAAASSAPALSGDVALAWLCFVALLALALVAIPAVAALVRLGLSGNGRSLRSVEPIAFGHSPHAQRSPRQPVRLHRTLLATVLLALPALLLLLGVGVIRDDGVAAVRNALALVLPMLVVTLHARRRSTNP